MGCKRHGVVGRKCPREAKPSKWDWNNIQKDYDGGLSYKEITEKYSISKGSIEHGKARGLFIPRSISEANKMRYKMHGKKFHSKETREKISLSVTRFLKNNPDMVPYRRFHKGEKSYPEIIFENALKSSGIEGWIFDYTNSIYSYDFAFPEKKIDVEIDGGTHTQEKVQKKDKRRDSFSKENGWVVLRFSAERVKKDVIGCINELKMLL